VELRWNPRSEEGFSGARIFRSGRFGTATELARLTQPDADFRDENVSPGKRYRYFIVLEREAAEAPPPSRIVEVEIPKETTP
jgi:hypothetical protein